MRGVHSQVNGQIADTLVAASDSVSFILNFLHNRGEIREFLSLCVKKLSILDRPIDKLENQGTSCDNTRSSRQKVPEIIFVSYIFSSFGEYLDNHLPTKFSKTDDFPADCPPTTAI